MAALFLPRGRPNSCLFCVLSFSWREVTKKTLHCKIVQRHRLAFLITLAFILFPLCIGLGVFKYPLWLSGGFLQSATGSIGFAFCFIRNSERLFTVLFHGLAHLFSYNWAKSFGYLTPPDRLCIISSFTQWLAPDGYRMLSQADRDFCKRFFFFFFFLFSFFFLLTNFLPFVSTTTLG